MPCTESARCREGLRAFVDEAGRDKPIGDHLAQVLGRARLHARGDLLGQEFDQQVGHFGQKVKNLIAASA
jgi:hypothetical protein